MKKLVMLLVVVLVVVSPRFAGAFERFEVGLRVPVITEMTHGTSESGIVGSINEFEPTGLSVEPFVGYHFAPWLGVELAYESKRFSGNGNYSGIVSSDGDFTFEGPALSVIGRLPNKHCLTPYLGVGVAYLFGGFEEEGWWGQGFTSQADFEQFGPKSVNGKIREMDADNALAFSAFLGTDVRIWRGLFADMRVGYQSLSTDAHYTISVNGTQVNYKGPFHANFDNISASVGLKYLF